MARILIIDDTYFMRGTLEFILKNAGHEIVGLGKDGAEAVTLYRELKPDLITLDILMKGTDGLSALKTIREMDPAAKVVMVTALGQDEKEEVARRLGAAEYIRKPFKQSDIIKTIEKALNETEK